MNSKLRFFTLVAILISATLVSTGVAIAVIYQTAVEEERNSLLDLVKTQARTFETIARSLVERGAPAGAGHDHEQGVPAEPDDHGTGIDAAESDLPPEIRAIVDTHEAHGSFSPGKGIALARITGNEVHFFMSHVGHDHVTPAPIALDAPAARPVLLALDGKRGAEIGETVTGAPALIAYDSIKGTGVALVGTIELAALRAPFLRAGALAGTIAIAIVIIGAILYNRVFGQILANLQSTIRSRTSELTHELAERKQREAALSASEQRFRTIVDNVGDAIVLIDTEGRIESFNAAAETIFGFAEADMLGENVSILLPAGMRAEQDELLRDSELRAPGIVDRTRELTGLRKDGTVFPIELHVAPMELDGARKIVGIVRDITVRRAAEETIRQSEEKFRRAFEDAQTGVILVDPDGVILQANKAFCEMLGYSEKELIGLKPGSDLTYPDDVERSVKTRRDALESGTASAIREEKRYVRKNGAAIWASVSYSFIRNDDGSHAYSVGHIENISDRKQAEMALAASEERFRGFFEDATIPMSIAELSGKFIKVNRALCEFLGFSDDELIRMSVGDILVPEDASDSNRERSQARSGQFQVRSVERRYRHKSGRILYGIANRAILCDADGKPMNIITQVQDLSARRQAEQEKEKLEAELRQFQKMEAVGQLAAGIAHEINTPIQYIGDNISFVEQSFDDLAAVFKAYRDFVADARKADVLAGAATSLDETAERLHAAYLMEEIPASMRQSLEGVGQVARIVRAMKEFSHPGQREKTAADINRALENTITVCRNEWKHVAMVATDLDPNLPEVECMVGELNQVFLNLIINASHAIVEANRSGDGRIDVSTRRDGAWIEIRVADNGAGIPDDARPKIFEPFFTTKEVGRGTGQGLAVTYDVIVNKHGGKIDVESRVGEGTCFVIRIPIDSGTAGSVAA
jgi:PAS domain S-box-containing protein